MASHPVVWVAGFLSTIVLFCGGDRAYSQTRQAPPQVLLVPAPTVEPSAQKP